MLLIVKDLSGILKLSHFDESLISFSLKYQETRYKEMQMQRLCSYYKEGTEKAPP